MCGLLALGDRASGQDLPSAPPADGLEKWLGSAYSFRQEENHERYWNQATPENAGKWGSVESQRDQMFWEFLDDAYRHTRRRMPYR